MSASAPATAQMRPLSDDQQILFRGHGYTVLHGFANQQVSAALLAAIQDRLANVAAPAELGTDVGYAGTPPSREAEDGRTAYRLLDADSRDTPYTEQARDPRMAAAITQPIGGPVYLSLVYHDCVIIEHPAFSVATHWHRDSHYWSFKRNELVLSWLALVGEAVDDGCSWAISGNHKLNLPADQFDIKLFLRQELPENHALTDTAYPMPLLPDDMLLSHYNTFRATRADQTATVKSSAVFTYYGPDSCPLPGMRSSARSDPLVS